MGERLNAEEALLLHVIAMVEETEVAVHRSGGNSYLEVGLHDRGRLLFIEADGTVTEDGGRARWPTLTDVEHRLAVMFPSVARRLRAPTAQEADAPVR